MRHFFSSYHNYLDAASGAAISTRAVLLESARRGWDVRVFCGAFFDGPNCDLTTFYESLRHWNISYNVERFQAVVAGKSRAFRLVRFNDSGVDATVFFPDVDDAKRPRYFLSRSDGELFLKLFVDELNKFKPDVYSTYGGYWAAPYAAEAARRSGARTVFLLHNLAYNRRELFDAFDSIVVPSEFARTFYRKNLGVESTAIPPLIDETKIRVENNSRRFLTFVNPSSEKGRYFFIGIARELNRLCPEIPILVVEARAKIDAFGSTPEARTLRNLYALENVADPREFYRQTRILLAPSLCEETFGRVAVEAAFNEIPVVCSNRGATSEIFADAGEPSSELILEIPAKFTPNATIVPNAAEVAPWVDAILKLWNDDVYAKEIGRRAAARAARYSFQNVAEQTAKFFTRNVDAPRETSDVDR